jgi:Tfp pilus assembly protein PilF
VSTVLSGRVRKQGSKLRISAELVDLSDGTQHWAESYETERDDLRMIKETISRAAIYTLRFQISRAQIESVEKRTTRNAEAYNLFLLGRYYANRRTPADLTESIVCFKRAVELDPRYSAAHAALANSYHLIVTRGILPPDEAIRKCEESAARALELDAGIAEAHLALGSNEQHYRWNWQAAEQHLRAAVTSDPGSALAHHWLAGLLSMLGKQDEALAEIEIARDLDPLSLAINTAYGAFLHRARKPDAAIQQLRWVLARDSTFRNAYSVLAAACAQAHKLQDAISAAELAVKLTQRAAYALGTLGYCLALAGRTGEALRLAEDVKVAHALTTSSACPVAQIYLGLGDLDQTFHWLAEALKNRDPNLTILKVDPANDPLRQDARFRDLLSKLQL